MNGEDVRMVESRCGACFLLESQQTVCVIGERSRQDFDGDLTIQARVTAAIDFTHPSRAKLRQDFIRAKLCARGNRHFFNSIVQLSTTVRGRVEASSCGWITRRLCLSAPPWIHGRFLTTACRRRLTKLDLAVRGFDSSDE